MVKGEIINDIRDIVGNVNDERQEIPEILLMSSNENNERGSKPQHVQLFKLLVNWSPVELQDSTCHL